jgi:hypothetical protein
MTRNDPVHIGTYALRGAIAAMAMTGMRVVTVGLNLLPKDPPEEVFEDALPQFLELVPREYRDEAIELAHRDYGGARRPARGRPRARSDRRARRRVRLLTSDETTARTADTCANCGRVIVLGPRVRAGHVDTTAARYKTRFHAVGSYSFSSITTNGAANGILLDAMGSSAFSATGGSIVGATMRGVDINAGEKRREGKLRFVSWAA